MAVKSITVSVSKRILHIGGASYPLANIARVQSQKIEFRRWPAIRAFIIQAVVWTALGVAATYAINYASGHDLGGFGYESQRYLNIVRPAWAVLTGLSLVLLLVRLAPTWRQYYALVIETAGTPNAVLINPDRGLIEGLVVDITHALEEPDQAYFPPVTINNYQNNNYGTQKDTHIGPKNSMSVS